MDDLTTRPWLADWRRRVFELYADVRRLARLDAPGAWALWRAERDRMYRLHPQSPVPAGERDAFRSLYWPYDDRLRFEVLLESHAAPPPASAGSAEPSHPRVAAFPPLEPAAPAPPAISAPLAPLALPNSGSESLAFDRLGTVTLPLPGGDATIGLFWMRGYAGGLFLPLGDATNNAETYGAGRYLLDTAKGADLGGDPAAGTLVVDLNFAFQPSCAFDPRWACPLAPPENRIGVRVEAGERLR
jgi:uncharacterized protein (DUF1684 family)